MSACAVCHSYDDAGENGSSAVGVRVWAERVEI